MKKKRQKTGRLKMNNEIKPPKKKKPLPSIKIFPDKQIASIADAYFDEETGLFEVELKELGMTREEIEFHFPPPPSSVAKAIKNNKIPLSFNMRKLMRSMIYEEWSKQGNKRPAGNVRRFFYTNVIYTFTRIMEFKNMESLYTSLNNAWGDLINSGMITYEDMNITSGKGEWLHSFARHSPFSNFIICVEKESLLQSLSWIAKIFRTTIVTAGGQPSRSAIRNFVKELVDWKCDVDKLFNLLIITDLDPAGDYIEGAFNSQIDKAVKYYNDKKGGTEEPSRLFLTLDQISDGLLNEFAVPAFDKNATTKQAIKSAKTKIKRFREKLGKDCDRLMIDDVMMKVELEVIKPHQMERKIVSEFIKLIEDHSLIIIPEIMNETETQRNNVIHTFYEEYIEENVNPLIEEFLEPVDEGKNDINDLGTEQQQKIKSTYNKIEREMTKDRYNMEDLIDEQYKPMINKYEEYVDDLVSEEEKEIEDLEKQIEDLEKQIEELKDVIEEKVGMYREEIDEIDYHRKEIHNHLYNKQEHLLKPEKQLRDELIKKVQEEWEKYIKKLDDFKAQQRGKFGSHLKSVEVQYQEELNSEKFPVYFDEIETNENIQKQMAYLLTEPELLLDEKKSCLQHPKPVFREDDILEAAISPDNYEDSKRYFSDPANSPDLSKFRDEFSEPFKDVLREYMKSKLDDQPISIDEITDLPEEYGDELNILIEEVKKEIKEYEDKLSTLIEEVKKKLEEERKKERAERKKKKEANEN
jgi:hypothetical protein